ncbi:MAG TPA: hypothetical protein DCX12_00495 [Chloroflexi bacterium]|jgi:glucosamine--fructose-6-phosphate aminotransferase (isomerizing)|nr:hypothetical protein [Chloroflexota bacterium]
MTPGTPAPPVDALKTIYESELNPSFVSARPPTGQVRLFGMGASYNVSIAAQPFFAEAGLTSHARLSTDAQLFGVDEVASDDLAILVSYTGDSRETVAVAEILRRRGVRRILGVTNDLASPLASACSDCWQIGVDPPRPYYLIFFGGLLFALYKLACRLGDTTCASFASEAAHLESALDEGERLARSFSVPPHSIDALGRGPDFGTASQAALVAREFGRICASPWETGNYRHGPIETCSDDNLVLLYVSPGEPARSLDLALAKRLHQLPGRLLTFPTDGANTKSASTIVTRFRALTGLAPIVVMAYAWANLQGFVPGKLRYTSREFTDEIQ